MKSSMVISTVAVALLFSACGGGGTSAPPSPSTYTIGGTVSGLSGTGLVLQNNGGDNLPISANGGFTFITPIASGGSYSVTIVTQPSGPTQTCALTNANGTANAKVTNIQVTCTSTVSYTVGGTVSGLSGTGLVLQDNGGDNLSVSTNGAFSFSTPIASGGAYNVTVLTQPSGPSQTCAVTGGSATAIANVTNVHVTCTSARLTVTSVSSSTPTALTPIYIGTTGLDLTASVTVQFSNISGFLVSEQPIRVASDGTVVIAVPLYVDPSSGQIGPGTVSVVLTQGSLMSTPVTLNIQNLPTASTYGAQPGQISHDFLTYVELRAAARLGELQAFQELPGNTIDTSQAQASVQNLLISVIQARNDVDRVTLDSALVIDGGNLSNGTPIQFDQNSLNIMDSVFGLYLTQLSSVYSPPSGVSRRFSAANSFHLYSISRLPSRKGSRREVVLWPWGQAAPRTSLLKRGLSGKSASVHPNSLSDKILSNITAAGNLVGLTQAYSDAFAKDPTTFDKVLAASNAGSALYGIATAGGTAGQAVAGAALGALLSGVSLLHNTVNEFGDLEFIMWASRYGDPAVLQEAQNDLNNNAHNAAINAIQTDLNLAAVGGYFGSFGSGVVGSFLDTENVGGQIAIQSAGLITGVYGCVTSPSGLCYAAAENTALSLAAEVTNVFSSDTQGFAPVTGTVNIANDQGSTLAGDTGIAVGGFDVQGSDMTALADPNGNYDFFIALQAANTNYTNLAVTAFDPVTGNILASTPVDLSGLNTNVAQQLPTLQGSCTDPGAPDGDDPDCD